MLAVVSRAAKSVYVDILQRKIIAGGQLMCRAACVLSHCIKGSQCNCIFVGALNIKYGKFVNRTE